MNNVRPQLKMLAEEQIHDIHEYTLKLLETTGVRVDSPSAVAMLKNRIRSTKTNLTFYNRRHAAYIESDVWRAFTEAKRRAQVENFRFHDLRHTVATRVVQSKRDLYGVQRLLGHKNAAMTQRYAHHCVESLRPLLEALDSTISAQSGGVCQGAAS